MFRPRHSASTSRTQKHLTLEIFDDDGEHIIDYTRPTTTGFYYGPRTPTGTAVKGAGHNPSAGSIGTSVRTVSKGGYIGALASKFYAGYKRKGEQVTVVWDATTVTLSDASGATINAPCWAGCGRWSTTG